MRVAVEAASASGAFAVGAPARVIAPGNYTAIGSVNIGRTYDVAPDGTRFLMIKDATQTTAAPPIVVVQHFDEELKRLVPTK